MKKVIALLAIVALAACNSSKKASFEEAKKFSVENLGEMNNSQIKEFYPDANIEEGTDMMEEGTLELAYTVLYPDTPDELLITWQSPEKTNIKRIHFSEDGRWTTDSGVKIGTTYERLNKMNGKTISFYGFGWDYSGAVDWNGGKLEKSGLHVFLAPNAGNVQDYYGDHIIKATPEEIKNLDLKVASIMLDYSN
ncbi:hypothetical protein C7S20_06845 [Christiangramia fulva]|uniref:Lipoprotein n=1 Tax=Christiangramia fulva TaxID=2126553 RepID=A0A2R3Z412_9FLAO|nr:hypothetical protein [Christiangramia fulva]AVR45010.1 hypothetical protein C7S20_06845 [Christiangramia fulva]